MRTTLLFLFVSFIASAQYDSLQKLDVPQKVYYSNGVKARAESIAKNVSGAETYFKQQLSVSPDYTLLILTPADWKKFAHPKAIYGIPHFLPDGRLVVASDNNDFWRANMKPLENADAKIQERIKKVYGQDGGPSLQRFFDLLAIHELGHAFQSAAKLNKQRSWLSELSCNIMLHTYIAEKQPDLLEPLTVFPAGLVNATNPESLKYDKMEDFDAHYTELATQYPENYGWYQCRFHVAAGQIYDKGGVKALKSLWAALLANPDRLDDKMLYELLSQKPHSAVGEAWDRWNRE